MIPLITLAPSSSATMMELEQCLSHTVWIQVTITHGHINEESLAD